jgi:GntR family transcriptional repressor for pyruvate dehydrogenase complex
VQSISHKAFRAVRKTRVTGAIIEQIRDLIVSGHFKLGDRLPAERDLAVTLHVGRPAVREAIRALEFQGLVETRPGEGTFLSAGPDSAALNLLDPARLRLLDTVRKLFEVRRVVEPDLAALAAMRSTPELVEKMRAALKAQQDQIERGESGIEGDTAFHAHIAEAAGNEFLIQIMNSLMERIRDTREDWLQGRGRSLRSVDDHGKILRAIENRDPEAAEQDMFKHLEGVERMLFAAPDGPEAQFRTVPPTLDAGDAS